ncbi:MAG: hypothetical protein JW954_05845 [Dehalococcoidaceae bacterium]|nr:hypothetical protein [Dehalococcoidaceae bacterium]
MKIDKNITDTLRATVIVLALAILAVAGIQAYISVTTNETEQIHHFLSMASSLHDDIDGNLVFQDITGLIDTISAGQIENAREMELAISHGAYLTKAYKERFYNLVSVTDNTLALKNSLIREGGFLLSCYHYLRLALESRTSEDSANFSANIEQTRQYLDDAMALRSQNRTELERWITEIEA